MDYLRQGIHLRSYAQKDPKQEYKREAFALFSRMLTQIKRQVIGLLLNFTVSVPQVIDDGRNTPAPVLEDVTTEYTSNRNSPCPCGSGKKFKQCCAQFL